MNQNPKIRTSLEIPQELADRIDKIMLQKSLSRNEAITIALREYADREAPRVPKQSRIEYMLREQTGKNGKQDYTGGGLDFQHADDWEIGGARWFLKWLLRREPDWQKFHTVMFPRHWPLPLHGREHRCSDNGGSSRGVMNHISEYIDSDCRRECRFPIDFGTLTVDEWEEIVDRFRGCCGERLRPPNGPHWDDICELSSGGSMESE